MLLQRRVYLEPNGGYLTNLHNFRIVHKAVTRLVGMGYSRGRVGTKETRGDLKTGPLSIDF